MTNEQAIKRIKWFLDFKENENDANIKKDNDNYYYCIDEKDFEAFEMAIQALQADGKKYTKEMERCDTCKHYNEFCETPMIRGCKLYEQADGDLISRQAVIDIIEDVCPIYGNDYRYILREEINELPSVAIPTDHDGCKDCRWESQYENEIPCMQCKQNYTDKWQKKPHWIFKKFDDETGISDSYWCSECNKPLASTYKNYCANCGAKME